MAFPELLERDLAAIRASAVEPAFALAPMLRAAQRALGWLSPETLANLAARAGVGAEDAGNIADYLAFRRDPPPAAISVEVCVNVHCQHRGGAAILARCKARLGLDVGGRSPGGRFALDEVVCLKRCASGPSMRVNGEILDELTPGRVDEILAEIVRDIALASPHDAEDRRFFP
jgi:NADH:ubiquinone oxidoreductase subunit E